MIRVANNDNRTNSQGLFQRGRRDKASSQIRNIIPAGGTLPLPVSGCNFYLLLTSATVKIRPAGGQFDEYTTGTGLRLPEENAFDQLEINNPNAFAIAFSIFIGWDDYDDRRLILANQSVPMVVYPTYPTANAATNVQITDRSGQVITDINLVQWYAVYRVAILVFNPDTGVTLLVQKSGSVVAGGPSIGVVYPQTSLRLDVGGDYTLHLGGANINAIVSEIYACIPK